jgi:uncharacterized damage-inducible protein DinB
MTATASATELRAMRPAPDEYAPYYGTYLGKVADGDIVRTLRDQIGGTVSYLRSIPASREGHRYAPGKWSIRQVVGHLSDAERVFAYRALRFARGDSTPLPGFDENEFMKRSRLDDRTLASVVDEYAAVRAASVALFDSLFAEEWSRHGTASGKEMSVRALAWVIAGHELHHLGVLKTRYV